MKKFFLGFAMLLAAGTMFAQEEYLTVSPSTISLKPGETQDVTFTYNGPLDNEYLYNAIQLEIEMPVGVEPTVAKTVKRGKQTINYNVDLMNSLGDQGFQYGENFVRFDDPSNDTDHNIYRILIFIMGDYTFPYGPDEGETWENIVEDLFRIRLLATDELETGKFKLNVTEIKFTYPDFDDAGNVSQIGVPFTDVALDYNLGIDYTIGESGYGTLCWPKALDFSANEFDANIGVDVVGATTMLLSSVQKVPASTPVVIKGEPGTYSLVTTKEETEDVSANILFGTPTGTLTVAEGDNIFALAKKTEGIGFYRCQPTVVIPKYKAYYSTGDASAVSFLFDDASGIQQVDAASTTSDMYTISGVKVDKAAQKGVYIVNGKKIVVK